LSERKEPREQKKEYTFEEDTMITAQAAANIVLSTKEGVDPVPFIAAFSWRRGSRDLTQAHQREANGEAQNPVKNAI
jgi:hypothetical protein